MAMEEANNRALEINKEIIKNSERVDELRFAIDSLIGKVLDLAAKLDSLGVYK